MASRNAIIAIFAAGIIVAGGVAAFAAAGTSAKPEQDALALLTTPTMPAAHALGSPDARVTIVEFGDYLCTYCHRFHEETRDRIIADYVDTGKARFLFKDFPINDHLDGGSSLAARASYCAADQGMYWQFHEHVYDNWGGERAGWVTEASMAQFAADAGVKDIDEFKSCLDSDKYADKVRGNYQLARSAGLRGTPSFIIIPATGEPTLIPGAYPYESFKQVLDSS